MIYATSGVHFFVSFFMENESALERDVAMFLPRLLSGNSLACAIS